MQTHVVVSLATFKTEFSGQTIFVQVLLTSSHLKPVSQRHCVFYLFGDALNGHYWHVLLIEIDFVLQTQTLFSKTSFLLQETAQAPLTTVKPALQTHWVPFQDEFGGHSKHCPFIMIAVFFSQIHDFRVKSKIAPVGHLGIASQFYPFT